MIDCGSKCADGDILGFPYTLADNFADDANDIAKWLRGEGFSVERVSQYWDNDLPAVRASGSTEKDKRKSLQDGLGKIFKEYKEKLKCCDNFFLYISGHGSSYSRFLFYDPSGTGLKAFIKYSTINEWLSEFPECVKFTIFIDACWSGKATKQLKKLRDTHSKVVIITSTDEDHECPGGQGATDSATDNFNEAED